jgi:ribosomal protein L7/L12
MDHRIKITDRQYEDGAELLSIVRNDQILGATNPRTVGDALRIALAFGIENVRKNLNRREAVYYTKMGEDMIRVIKALRMIDRPLGLKEAKKLCESAPCYIEPTSMSVKDAVSELLAAGAEAEVRYR